MYCIKCGNQIPEGHNFCTNCGEKNVSLTEEVPAQAESTLQVQEPVTNNETLKVENEPQVQNNFQTIPPKKKKKISPLVIVLIVVGVVIVSFILFCVGVYYFVVSSSSKMVCTSTEGNITLMYNDDMIVGYTAVGIEYDLDGQRELANQMGVEAYLEEFSEWFSSNTDGICTYQKKSSGTTNPKPNTNTSGTKTVGDAKYGYITIPDNWYDFKDIDGNDSLQFSYANIFIVSMNYFDDTSYDAKELASNYMYNKQQSTDVTDVTGATLTIGNNKQYTAYQIYMYYPEDQIFLVTYWFKAEDGKVHYLAIEGPGEYGNTKLSDLLDIPESFHMN